MSFTQRDMLYTDYAWSTRYTGDDPRVTGEPDNTLLNRTEGWEMLYFINKCAEKWGWLSADNASRRKLEKAIRQKVPGNIRTQRGIKEWIELNHKSFWATI
jgi:hypothetical protein